VRNLEPICAGLIAGGALMGITAMLEEVYGVQVWLLIMTTAATIAYALVLQSASGPLKTEVTPAGILSLEFAWTAARTRQIIADWSNHGVRRRAVLSLWLDFGFIVVYSATLALWGKCAIESLIPEPALARQCALGLFLTGVAAAAICDVLENCLDLWFLGGHPPQREFLPNLASHCARCKFAILIHLSVAASVFLAVGAALPR
jgi:hypothetical protein